MLLDNYTGKYTGAGQTIVAINTGISNNYTNNNVVYSYDFADNVEDNSITKAQNIGALVTGAKVLQSSVTKTTDDKDFYKFELSANSKVDFLLSKLSADVDLNLYDSSGNLIHGGWDWGNADVAYTKTLDAGVYFVEVDYYDGNNQGTTSTYDLSLAVNDVIIVPIPDTPNTPNTDNTIATAQNIGVLAIGTKVLQDSVTKTTDDKDFYKFELSANSKVDFLLSKLSADVDLNLYDSSGNLIYGGWDWGNVDIAYTKTLDAGVYFVEVDYYDGNSQGTTSTYDLSLTLGGVIIAPTPTPSTDNTIATAQDIGVLATDSTKVLQDSVTRTTDDKDFYKFELTANSQVDFSLSKLSADLDFYLYNASGDLLGGDDEGGNADMTYTKILATGVYFVEVEYYGGDSVTSTYDLSLTSSITTIPPDTDGSIAEAKDIGVLTTDVKVLQDSVTKTTDDKDFYKFELTANSLVDLSLSKLSANVNLYLYNASGDFLPENYTWGNNMDIAYTQILAAGVYFVGVEYYNGDYNGDNVTSTYDLSLTSSITTIPLDTDGSIAGAKDIGVLTTGVKVLQDSVTKVTDDKDFYKFELTANSRVDFSLSKLSADVDLNLYNASGGFLHAGCEWGNVDITYAKMLATGVYFLKVDYYGGINPDVTSTYDLSLTSSIATAPLDTDCSIAGAKDIGVLTSGVKVLQDSVTKVTDDKDFYKFELIADGKVDFLLSKLSADVDLYLYNSSGKKIHSGSDSGNVDIAYTKTLDKGVYFVEVEYDIDGDSSEVTTTYDLSLNLSATPDTDNTIATAQDIGVLAIGGTKALQDSVTKTTDDKDFYKFELTSNSKIDFLLSNLSATVNLNLYNEEGDTLQSGGILDNSDVSYTQLLAAGTYYAEVDYADYSDNQETSTTYDLSLTAYDDQIIL